MRKTLHRLLAPDVERPLPRRLLIGGAILSVALLVRAALPFDGVPFLLFIPAVMLVGLTCGGGPTALTVLASALLATYFFLPPRFSLIGHDGRQWFSLGLYVLVAGGVGGLCVALRKIVAERKADLIALKIAQRDLRDLNASLEAKAAERSAAAGVAEARSRAYFDLSPDYLLLVRIDRTGVVRFEDINPAAEGVFGTKRAAVAWRKVDEVVPALAARDITRLSHECLESWQPRSYRVRRNYRGPEVEIDALATPIERLPDGGALVLFSGRDVTVQGQIQEQLRQSQKMEAVGQLTGGVAHDFNNLLTVIKSSTDLLKRPNLREDRRVRYIEAISDTVDRAAKLTAQLLAFARRQALVPEIVDACGGVESVGAMMRTLIGSRIALDVDVVAEPCFIDVDPSQFDTALINLAVNARDAMSGEGRLRLEVRKVVEIPPVRSHPARAGAFVAISLRDTGMGIPRESFDRIFEPFFTTKKVGQGTGLGLSQVFGFAKQSGGDVAVESVVDVGSTFTIYLPQAKPKPTPEPSRPAPAVEAGGGGLRVLAVEDNPEIGSFLVQTLGDVGMVATLSMDAASALTRLAETPDAYDVVFSDVVMPGMNGVDLGREVSRLYPGLPFVLTSGYSHVLAEEPSHGFELVHKPYSVDILLRVLQRAAVAREPFLVAGGREARLEQAPPS